MTTISIQCTHCQKRYNAPATMAGKKVKCKHCGKVFAIPAAESEELENDAPQTGVPAPFKAVQKSTGAAAGSSGDEPRSAPAGGKLGQASAGYAARMARSDNAVEVELADDGAPVLMLRPSIPHDFPGAEVLDQWGAYLMIVLGLGWLSLMAIRSNGTNLSWVGTTRLGAYLFLSLCVAFPLGYLAVRMAAEKCRLNLPPKPAVRALGAFSLSFAVALVFWLSGESMGMLITGTLLGMVVVCVSVWFLFRVQSQEMSTILGSAGSAFIGSIVVSYLVLLGINAIFASAARSSPNNQLAVSPMGPTFDWDVPVSQPSGKKTNKVGQGNPDTQPETTASTVPAVPDTQPNTTTSPSTHAVIASTDPVQPPIVTTVPTPPPTTTITPPVPEIVVKPATAPVVVAAALSPLVAKVSAVADVGDFNQVVFPSGAGNVIATIKKGETEETVTFYSGNPLTMKGETKFDVEKDVAQKYCLSANGDTLARLTAFPKLGVMLWNTTAKKEAKVVPLNSERGRPELLGFAFNDNLVVLWNTGSFIDVEVINAKANPPQNVVLLRLKTFERSPCNPTISPDGRQMAVATFIDKKGGIDLWDLTSNRRSELRTCYVPLGTWVTPTSVTYSATGQLSTYFELGAKGVIYNFRVGDGGLIHEFPYRTLPYPAGAADAFTGRTLDYIDANDWLLLGRPIIDIESGKVLGDLQIENVKAQHVMDKETLLLHMQTAEGKSQLLEVKLKADAMTAKRAEVRGVRTPKTP